ncbi:Protein LTV1 [Rhynchospora pubera]|uniref:Protein LTV1 n=1 Tax=Rhynchospora pubera TaxID=906938 RepID=A0AAV8D8W8_9POAL|nr:Protein LTV1 [Rhynchospora pubera]
MGGKKKKSFIDKKRSATFTLVARDSASSSDPLSSNRVFVRTDNHYDYSVPGFLDSDEEQYNRDGESSIFADAVEESGARYAGRSNGSGLPEEVRKEILELGLPDDGYNYLMHLREIRNQGGGSAYYENPRARFDLVPLDVKAYDASRVRLNSDAVKDDEPGVDTIYKVASKSAPVRVQKAIDPDVIRLLDDSDLSRFGSDVEDLEEDFVLMANQPDGEEDENDDVQVKKSGADEEAVYERESDSEVDDEMDDVVQQRVRRPLDDAFDEAFKEYLSSDEDNGPIFGDENQAELEEKLKGALKDFNLEDSVQEEVYKAPADSVKDDQEYAQVIRKCTEYAQKYLNESEGEEREVVLVSESSDESEMWDCETIVSTYSNLDNHPAKIEAPGNPKRRLPPKSIPFPGELGAGKDVITLGGKEMLPVNYLPQRRKIMEGLVREKLGSAEKPKKVVGEESKEEKKERKVALKNERREARRAKKELKGLYKSETQRAQKAVAVTGPSSIHLM